MIKGSFQHADKTGLEVLPAVDMIVCGSVAVTEKEVGVGKGGVYSELEYAILRELKLVEEDTPRTPIIFLYYHYYPPFTL